MYFLVQAIQVPTFATVKRAKLLSELDPMLYQSVHNCNCQVTTCIAKKSLEKAKNAQTIVIELTERRLKTAQDESMGESEKVLSAIKYSSS